MEENNQEQQQLYINVIEILQKKQYLELEEALEQLFLSDYDASTKEIGEIIYLLNESCERSGDVIAYNPFLLTVLHSLHQFQWKETVEKLLTYIYETTPPMDIFLFQKEVEIHDVHQ